MQCDNNLIQITNKNVFVLEVPVGKTGIVSYKYFWSNPNAFVNALYRISNTSNMIKRLAHTKKDNLLLAQSMSSKINDSYT